MHYEPLLGNNKESLISKGSHNHLSELYRCYNFWRNSTFHLKLFFMYDKSGCLYAKKIILEDSRRHINQLYINISWISVLILQKSNFDTVYSVTWINYTTNYLKCSQASLSNYKWIWRLKIAHGHVKFTSLFLHRE